MAGRITRRPRVTGGGEGRPKGATGPPQPPLGFRAAALPPPTIRARDRGGRPGGARITRGPRVPGGGRAPPKGAPAPPDPPLGFRGAAFPPQSIRERDRDGRPVGGSGGAAALPPTFNVRRAGPAASRPARTGRGPRRPSSRARDRPRGSLPESGPTPPRRS